MQSTQEFSTSQQQYAPPASYEKLSKKYDNTKNNIKFIAYQKALNSVMLNGHGKTNIIAVNIASDLINATLNNLLDVDGYFKIRYTYYAMEFGKSRPTIRRAVNLLRDIGIVEKEQKSYNQVKTHCANAIHLKLNVTKLLEVVPNLLHQFSKNSTKMIPSSYQNDTIIVPKCHDVDNTSNTLNKDNLDAKTQIADTPFLAESESKESRTSCLNLIEVKEEERTVPVASTEFNDTTCNLMKFHPVSQRTADEINKRAGRSFSIRFMNMRVKALYEEYKGTTKAIFKNEYCFIGYMEKLFRAEKITEAVANNPAFEFRATQTPTATTPTDTQEVREKSKYEDIDQSTTLGKIQARAFKQYGEAIYNSWFKPLLTLTECDKRLVIECKTKFAVDYLYQRYFKLIESSFESRPYIDVKDTQLVIIFSEQPTITNQEPIIQITKSENSTANNTVVKMSPMLTKFIKTMDEEDKQHEIVEKKEPQTEEEMLAEIAELFNNNN